MRYQADLLEKFFGADKALLILFDAARYDVFKELYPDYFEGDLYKAHNGDETFTHDWFSHHCRGDLNCTLYTAAPVAVRNWSEKPTGYDPTDHFNRVIGFQDFDFDYDKGTSSPQKINRVVLEKPDNKMFVRYLQPHPPFIGEPAMPWTKGSGKMQRAREKISTGEITRGELMESYKKNMRLAFEGAEELVKEVERPVWITSDHGEALGEKGYYFHARGHPNLPVLVEVPWFEVE